MQHVIWIGLAGAVGAILRYLAHRGTMLLMGPGFPYGTLLVNVVGSFLIGALFVAFWERAMGGDLLRLSLMVGLLGSFTTFSAFSLDTWILVHHGAYLKAAVNVAGTVVTCLAATWLGIVLTRMIY